MAIFQFRTGLNLSRILENQGEGQWSGCGAQYQRENRGGGTILSAPSYFRRETCTDLPVSSKVIL